MSVTQIVFPAKDHATGQDLIREFSLLGKAIEQEEAKCAMTMFVATEMSTGVQMNTANQQSYRKKTKWKKELTLEIHPSSGLTTSPFL